MPNISNAFKFILFADDTTLSLTNNNITDLNIESNNELKKFYDWSIANRLTINTDKTFFNLITNIPYPNELSPQLKINNEEITRNPANLFLGVTIDEKIKFNLHINQISKKVSKSIGILNKLKYYLTASTMRNLYFTLVHPYLSYCNLVWGNTYTTHLTPLILLQKKAIRIINNAAFDAHTNELFYSSGITKLVDLNKLKLAIYMYKNQDDPVFSRDHSYNTRSQSSLLPTFQRLTVSQQSIYYSGPVLWNSIPPYIKESPTIFIFKKRYKRYLIDGYASG